MYRFNAPLFLELPSLLGFPTVGSFISDWGRTRKSYDTIRKGNPALATLLELSNRYHFSPTAFFISDTDQRPSAAIFAASLQSSLHSSSSSLSSSSFSFSFSYKGAFFSSTGEAIRWRTAMLSVPMSQPRVARALNPSPTENCMRSDDLLHVCNTYGVTPSIFFTEESTPTDAKQLRIQALLKELNDLRTA